MIHKGFSKTATQQQAALITFSKIQTRQRLFYTEGLAKVQKEEVTCSHRALLTLHVVKRSPKIVVSALMQQASMHCIQVSKLSNHA